MIGGAPPDKLFVVSGGFEDVGRSRQDVDVSALRATHEEADTCIILHAINVDVNTLIVSVRDTDVLLLLVSLDDGKYSKEKEVYSNKNFRWLNACRISPINSPFPCNYRV